MTNSPAIISRDRIRRGLAALPWAVACAMLAYAFIAGGYFVTIMSFAMIYAVFIIGLNVFMGFAGQVSFGHNAFAALSGYTSAVLTATYGWEPIAAFAVGSGSPCWWRWWSAGRRCGSRATISPWQHSRSD